MDVTWKNVMTIPIDWNTLEVLRARTEYVHQLLLMMDRNRVYLDETGFNLHTKKSKGRALAGNPATITVVPKGKRITLISALSLQGMIHTRIVHNVGEKKGTNAEDFRNFLLDLVPKIPRGSVLILDNAKIHHANNLGSTWNMLKQTYDIDYFYLPPYSPFLNPIELAFHSLKEAVKGCTFFNRGELLGAIERCIPLTTAAKAEGYFHHSAKFHRQCLLGLPFTGKPIDPNIEPAAQPTSSSAQIGF